MTNRGRQSVLVVGALLATVAMAPPTPAGHAQGLTGQAQPDRPVTLIDDRLELQPVRLIALDERTVTYETRYGRRRQRQRGEILAIVTQPDPAANVVKVPGPTGMIVLTDGRRFAGDLAGVDADGDESLVWRHGMFGQVTIPLEEIRWLIRPAATDWLAFDESTPSRDEIVLGNGDRVEGFLASVGSKVVVETDGGSIEVDLERMTGAHLSNPPVQPSGARLWLSDGTVAPLDSITVADDGSVLIRLLGGPSQTYDWSPILGISFDASRLVPLSSLTPVSQRPGEGRRFAPPLEQRAPRDSRGVAPALDAWDLVLPGPMTVEYLLPQGTRRLSMTIQLDVGTRPWGDCEVVVRIDGVEIKRDRLWRQSPSASLSIKTPGRTLEIQVQAGRFGPINDRVVVHRPLLLVEPTGR